MIRRWWGGLFTSLFCVGVSDNKARSFKTCNFCIRLNEVLLFSFLGKVTSALGVTSIPLLELEGIGGEGVNLFEVEEEEDEEEEFEVIIEFITEFEVVEVEFEVEFEVVEEEEEVDALSVKPEPLTRR